MTALLGFAAATISALVIERQLDRHSAQDRLNQCADEHDRAVALAEFTPFHSVTINSREG